MSKGAKAVLIVAGVAALGFAQWQYGIAQLALDIVHPTAQTATAPAIPSANGSGAAGKGRIAFPTLVKLATAKKTDFPLIERSYGTMASPQVVNINARVSSQVTKVNVQDGQLVKAGDVLLELDDRSLQSTLTKDQATLAKDQATLVNAQIVLDRATTLFGKGAGAKQDVDSGTAAQKAAQQTVDADKAVIDADKLQLDFTKVKAPFAGKLGAVSVAPGALVGASTGSTTTGLMTITQMQPLKASFRLPEQALTSIRDRQAKGADIAVRAYASGSHDLLDTGKLTFIDSTVDSASGTIGMGAELANAQLAIWPGQRVGIEVEYGLITGALTVPTVAVQQGQIGSYVWLVDDQNKVKATPVKVARYEGGNALISDGLTENAQVVIEGQAKLADGGEVRTAKPADAAPAKASDAKPATTASEGAVSSTAEAAPTASVQKPKSAGDQAP